MCPDQKIPHSCLISVCSLNTEYYIRLDFQLRNKITRFICKGLALTEGKSICHLAISIYCCSLFTGDLSKRVYSVLLVLISICFETPYSEFGPRPAQNLTSTFIQFIVIRMNVTDMCQMRVMKIPHSRLRVKLHKLLLPAWPHILAFNVMR